MRLQTQVHRNGSALGVHKLRTTRKGILPQRERCLIMCGCGTWSVTHGCAAWDPWGVHGAAWGSIPAQHRKTGPVMGAIVSEKLVSSEGCDNGKATSVVDKKGTAATRVRTSAGSHNAIKTKRGCEQRDSTTGKRR